MKKQIIVFVMIFSLLILAGCGDKERNQERTGQDLSDTGAAVNNNTATPDDNKGTGNEGGKLGIGELYRYGSVKSYTYRTTTNIDGKANVLESKYSISSDTINGKAAWLQNIEMKVEGANVLTKLWIDKTTQKCLKMQTSMDVAGQKIDQPVDCPKEGPNAATSGDKAPEYTLIGKESVTVPAGTFSCDKYSINGVTVWIAKNVPLPVKEESSSQGTTAVTELVSYA